MARVAFDGSLESRDGTVAKGAIVANGYVEPIGDKGYRLFKRGGLNLVTTLASGAGQGIINFTNSGGTEILFAVQNGSLVLSDIPPASGVWASRTAVQGGGIDNYTAYASFGGYIWGVVGKASYYKSDRTATSWTTAASNIFSSVDSNTREQGALAVLGTTMYFVGPSVGGSGAGSKEVWSTTDGVTFTRITSAAAFTANPCPRVLVMNSKLWYLGGNGTNSIYSSSDGITWALVNSTPSYDSGGTRTAFSAVVHNGKLWVIGGRVAGVEKNDVWYSSDGVTWTQATAAAAFTAVRGAVVVSAGGIMYLAGGYSASFGIGVDQVYSSLNGVTWSAVSHSSFNNGAWSVKPEGAMGFLYKNQIIIYDGNGQDLYPTATTTGAATLGTVTSGFFDFAKNLDGSQIMAKSVSAAFKLNPSDGTVTSISSAFYPAQTVRGCVYLDGAFYVMEPDGTIWNSADEDCTTWNDTDFVTAEFEPDSGVCLTKFNNYIVALGQWTTQFFWDAANPTGSPLSPVQNGVLLIGCASDNSVAQIESTVIWMAQRKGQGSTFQKGRFIAMLEGTSYVQISTADVDRILDADDLATVYATVASLSGHNFYILALGTSAISLAYDLKSKQWYVWTQLATGSAKSVTSLTQTAGLATAVTAAAHGFADGDPVTIAGAAQAGYNLANINVNVVNTTTFTYPVDAATVTPATGTVTATGYTESYLQVVASCNYRNQQVFQAASGGKVFAMSDAVFLDDSLPVNFYARSKRLDDDTNNRKFCNAVTPIGDLISGTGLIRYSDDDYQTFSAYRRFTLSDVKPQNQRYGMYRRRAWQFRYTGATAYRLECLETETQKGTS